MIQTLQLFDYDSDKIVTLWYNAVDMWYIVNFSWLVMCQVLVWNEMPNLCGIY